MVLVVLDLPRLFVDSRIFMQRYINSSAAPIAIDTILDVMDRCPPIRVLKANCWE